MSELKQIQEDVGYLREVVERADTPRGPASIYYLWALITLVGFPLADFVGPLVGLFWALAGPIGGWITYRLAKAFADRHGRVSRSEGQRYALHWNGMMVAIVLAIVPVAMGSMSAEALSPIILLIVALSYFLAGVHLDHTIGWISFLMVGGYFLVLFLPTYPWSITGVAVAAGLAISGFRLEHRRDPA
jgi:hypothetical protein